MRIKILSLARSIESFDARVSLKTLQYVVRSARRGTHQVMLPKPWL